MSEKAALTKTSGKKAKESVSTKPKENLSQSMDSPVEQILDLQQTIGNQAVQRLINSGTLQAKLKIGKPSDKGGQKADGGADKAINMPETMQSGDIVQWMGSGGRPLPQPLRSFFESRFGHDLSRVRIHSGYEADRSNRTLGAEAFTYGDSIAFASGRYRPHTQQGFHLLSHEIAHTIQQRGQYASKQAKLRIGSTNNSLEWAADRAADAVMKNKSIPNVGTSKAVIRRLSKKIKGDPNAVLIIRKNKEGKQKIYKVKRIFDRTKEIQEKSWKYLPPKLRAGIDFSDVWVQINWCQSTKGKVRVGADIPKQIQELGRKVANELFSGKNPKGALSRTELTSFGTFEVGKSGWKIVGEVRVVTSSEALQGVSGGVALKIGGLKVGVRVRTERGGEKRGEIYVEYTPGLKVEKVKCKKSLQRSSKHVPIYKYKCFKKEHIPAHKERRSRFVSHKDKIIYIYFKYKKDEINYKIPRIKEEIKNLKNLLKKEYLVTGIAGYASPEGPIPKGIRFIGNEALAKKRALAAKEYIEGLSECKERPTSCVNSISKVIPEGKKEKFPLFKTIITPSGKKIRKEVEGPELAKRTTESFLKHPDETRHRTPKLETELKKALESKNFKVMKDKVYKLLRRAEITLVKKGKKEEHYEVQVPEKDVWQAMKNCPGKVLKEALIFFRLNSPGFFKGVK